LHQTFTDWELIIIDDGSRDDTDQVCLKYSDDKRFKYQLSQPRGVSAARNLGIEKARGDWLAFLDSDDVWLPAKLDRQLAKLQSTGDLVCHSDEIWIRRMRRVNPKKKHRKPEGWVFLDCLPLCAISPSSAIIHRSVFLQVGSFDQTYAVCEDYELWLRISARYRVSLVPEPLIIKFGGHDDQLSRCFWGLDRWRVRALYSVVRDRSVRLEWRDAAFEEMKRKLAVLIQGYGKRGRKVEAIQMSTFLGTASLWWRDETGDAQIAVAPPLPQTFESLPNSRPGAA
jgi:glycosyltransferase involved in cell wall biosynthesis